MKITYNKKQYNLNLFIGTIWLTFFALKLFFGNDFSWLDYGWLVIAFAYFGTYYYQRKYDYVTIENGVVNVNGPFGKKINLDEVKQIKKFAGDYILTSDKKELTINTQKIQPNLLAKLDAALEKLNVAYT